MAFMRAVSWPMRTLRDRVRFFAGMSGLVGHAWESGLHAARALSHARAAGWTFDWEDDEYGHLGDHAEWCTRERYMRRETGGRYGCEGHEVLTCVLRDAQGEVLAALGGIIDPDSAYSLSVEADLAIEALANERQCSAVEAL